MGIQKRKSSRFGCFFLRGCVWRRRVSKGFTGRLMGNMMAFPKRRGNSWKERERRADTGVHTGRPPHIIKGTERPVPAFEQPDTGETEGERKKLKTERWPGGGKEGNRREAPDRFSSERRSFLFCCLQPPVKYSCPGRKENISPYRRRKI